MKKYLLIALLAASIYTLTAMPYSSTIAGTNSVSSYGIPDGWYKANVVYYNYNTGTQATYTLKVLVSYGSVTTIDFGNGGSVHSGYNNEGYVYSGGYLSYQTDYSTGQITSASASVSISDNNGTRTFNITIT